MNHDAILGVDLAWAEGSSDKPANETGLACIDETGRVIDAGWARGTDAVVERIDSMSEPGPCWPSTRPWS